MLETSDAITKLLKSIIETISRRASEDYAIVMVSNAVKNLQKKYGFLEFIEIKNTKHSETGSMINIDSSIESIELNEVCKALHDLVEMIVTSMGKDAGFFFIRELRDKVGLECETTLNGMGLDLDFMQLSHVAERRQTEKFVIENSDIIKQILKALIDALEKDISRAIAISKLNKFIEEATDKYGFLKFVTINDIRSNLGDEEISVKQEINDIEPTMLGKAIEKFIVGVNKSLEEDDFPFIEEFKRHLTSDYISKLEEMGVNLNVKQFRYELIFKHVIKTLIDVLGKSSSQSYAVSAVNAFLRKIDTKFDFLRYVKVNLGQDLDDVYDISIMTNLDQISETDARRAIQKLLEEIIDALGKELGDHFINEFKNSLDRNYLLKIENMGINLHMIQLRQDFLGKT